MFRHKKSKMLARTIGKRRPKKKRNYEPERKTLQKNLRINKFLRLPLPQKYQTSLQCSVSGIIPAASFPASGFLLYIVKGNDLHLPFSVGNFNGANYTLAKGASALTTATLAPAGYGDFMQSTGRGFYNFSRVLASKIRVCVTPIVGGDTITAVVVPVNSAAAALPNSVISGASMPFSKGPILCTGNNNIKMNTIKNYISTAMLFGVSPQVVKSEDNYKATVNTDPSTVYEWYILLQTNDSATTGQQVNLDVIIKYYVEFEASSGAGLLDTEI